MSLLAGKMLQNHSMYKYGIYVEPIQVHITWISTNSGECQLISLDLEHSIHYTSLLVEMEMKSFVQNHLSNHHSNKHQVSTHLMVVMEM